MLIPVGVLFWVVVVCVWEPGDSPRA